MQNGDSTLLEADRHFEFVPEPFRIAGLTIPIGVYRYSTIPGTSTLGTQRRVAGDIVSASARSTMESHRCQLPRAAAPQPAVRHRAGRRGQLDRPLIGRTFTVKLTKLVRF